MKKSKENKCKKTSIGGQAVMEGVMMRGESVMATAVRDSDGIIRLESKRFTPSSKKKITKLPIIRGIVNFFSSMVMGTSVLMRSAEVFGEEEPTKFEKWLSEKFKINLMSVITTLSLIIGLALSIFLFVFLPHFITSKIIKQGIAYNFIEGGFRIAIFIAYLLLVSLLKDIRRVFMYHGAEHKTISCYEQGLPLTIENARSCTRLHNRCGTTFLFFVMLVSILVFSVANISASHFYLRFLYKIALLPLVAGLSYELLKMLAKTDSPLLLPLKAPGLLLQRITTSEPDDDMLEVAITAFNSVLTMQENSEIKESEFITAKKLSVLLGETRERLKGGGVKDDSEADWLVSIALGIKRDDLAKEQMVNPKAVEKIKKWTDERIFGRPLWYIIGDTEFYGCKIKVDERVLIPRIDTEILAEKVIAEVKEKGGDTELLELCTGSGAVAIAIKKNCETCRVTASDISEPALNLARENAELSGAQIEFLKSDLFSDISGKFDVIVANPPYIISGDIDKLDRQVKDFEPIIALDGGEDGLDFYKKIIKDCRKYLNKGGVLYLECGEGQADDIVKLLTKFSATEIIKDYADISRVIKATL